MVNSSVGTSTARHFASSTGRALGTSLHVVVTQPAHLALARAAVDDVVAAIDRTCSRFRHDSEISRLQARAGQCARISPLMLTALRAALRGGELSDGAADPTVGTAVRVVGYQDDFASVPRDGGPITLTVRLVPGWQCIRLDEVTPSVLIPIGVELDLGSTAKALAADLAAAAALKAMGGGGVLVNLGGDIAFAGQPPEGGWVVQVSESSDTPLGAGLEAIAVQNGGVATSSTSVRRWRRGRIEMHHIIDPGTGLPAEGPWRTVTCVAGSCLDANIAATGAIVRGFDAVDWLTRLGLPSRLLGDANLVVCTAGWPSNAGDVAPAPEKRR
jgi:thiamine biosynthesis lipoprotein ApbE